MNGIHINTRSINLIGLGTRNRKKNIFGDFLKVFWELWNFESQLFLIAFLSIMNHKQALFHSYMLLILVI